MFLTSKSEKNILYILKNFNNYITVDKKCNPEMLKNIYNLINQSIKFSKKNKHKKIETDDFDLIKLDIFKLNNNKFFPEKISNYLNEYINYKFTYTIKIKTTIVKLSFYTIINENNSLKKNRKYIENYIEIIKSWLFICNLYSKNNINSLDIKIFFTPFIKKLPENNETFKTSIISSINVNTGYTESNITDINHKNIVIYRKEEWFKVLIHETLHAFNLDFHNINFNSYIENFKKEFSYVESDFLFNEAYCEFWANIINLSYYSYKYSKGNYKDFELSFNININIERIFLLCN